MVKVDEFASIFRAAEREPFRYQRPPLARGTLVTDRDHEAAAATQAAIATFAPPLAATEWTTLVVDEHDGVAALADAVAASQPDVVAAFRHLGEASLVPQHSLGVYLDVLTQVTPQPVLVLPGTAADRVPLPDRATRTMAVTDHVTGDERLIGYAAALTAPGGQLWLCHIEDDATFERYLHAIGQIPELDTDIARRRIAGVLEQEARDYLAGAKAGLDDAGVDLTIEPHWSMGRPFKTLADHVAAHDVNLVVATTRDDDQLAMHATAYAVAVELIQTPLLLL